MALYTQLMYIAFTAIMAVASRPNIDLEKDGNPCTAAKLEVHARNLETGDWSVKLGDMEGKISHRAQSNDIDEEDSGQWHAGIYNNGNGCSDDVIYDSSEEETERPLQFSTEQQELTTKDEYYLETLGYTHFRNIGFYKYNSNGKTWSEAKRSCEDEGAHLAVIDSLAEKKAVLILVPGAGSFAKYEGYDQSFIGARSEDYGDTYTTVLGSTLEATDFLPWGPGEPSTEWGQEDCIALLNTGYLNNENCYRRMPYICEIEE